MNLNPIELCMLVIDVSGSMGGEKRIGEVNRALQKYKDFAKRNKEIGKKLHLSIIEFSDEVNIHNPKVWS